MGLLKSFRESDFLKIKRALASFLLSLFPCTSVRSSLYLMPSLSAISRIVSCAYAPHTRQTSTTQECVFFRSVDMSQPSSASTTYVAYYSAHRGPVWRSDGGFHHFARQCDPIHTKNGYWRFCTYQDDRRAYERGLSTPEAVLIAQDVGDGTYDDILLRWVSGELDTGNKPTVGTAAAHLETIYSERRLLGKSLSFRGRVPLYPVSTDQRLINYRLVRYGIQRGVFSETVFTSPSSQLSPSESVPLIPAQNHLHEASLLGIRLRGQVPSNFIDASNDTFAFLKTPAIESCGLEERYSAYDSQGVCYIPGSDEIANKLVGGISIPSRTALTPSELYDAQSAILPCIDCGIVGTHMSDCRIAGMALLRRFNCVTDVRL